MIESVIALMLSLSPRAPTNLAQLFLDESMAAGVSVELVLAVAFAESSFEVGVESPGGDLGLMQVRPTGMGSVLCRGLMAHILRPANNIRCGVRILAHARARCGGPPLRWLSSYNGRRCGPSVYSRKVLGLLARHP